jgi:hypothetical protein
MLINSVKLSFVVIAWLHLAQQTRAAPVLQVEEIAKTSEDGKTIYPVVHSNPRTPWVDDLQVTVTAYVEGPEDLCRPNFQTKKSLGSSASSSSSSRTVEPSSTETATGSYPVVNVDGSSDETVTITIKPESVPTSSQLPKSKTGASSGSTSFEQLIFVSTEIQSDIFQSVDIITEVVESPFYSTAPTSYETLTSSMKIVTSTKSLPSFFPTNSQLPLSDNISSTPNPTKITASATPTAKNERLTTLTKFNTAKDIFSSHSHKLSDKSSSLIEAISTSVFATALATASGDVTTTILNNVVITSTAPGKSLTHTATIVPEITLINVKTLLRTTVLDGQTVTQTVVVEKDQTTTLFQIAPIPTTTAANTKEDNKTITETLTIDGVEVIQTVVIDTESTVTKTIEIEPTTEPSEELYLTSSTITPAATDTAIYNTITQTITVDGELVTQTVVVGSYMTITRTLEASSRSFTSSKFISSEAISEPMITPSSKSDSFGRSTAEFSWIGTLEVLAAFTTSGVPSSTLHSLVAPSNTVTLSGSGTPLSNDFAAELSLPISLVVSGDQGEVFTESASLTKTIPFGLDAISVQTLVGETQPSSSPDQTNAIQQSQANNKHSNNNYNVVAEIPVSESTTTSLMIKGGNYEVTTTTVQFLSSKKTVTPNTAVLKFTGVNNAVSTSTVRYPSLTNKKTSATATSALSVDLSSSFSSTVTSTTKQKLVPKSSTMATSYTTSISSSASSSVLTIAFTPLSAFETTSTLMSSESLSTSLPKISTATTAKTSLSTPSTFVTLGANPAVTQFPQSWDNYQSTYSITSSASFKSLSSLSFGQFHNTTIMTH